MSDPVFRVSSTLVQLDVSVTDSKGRQVPDLRTGDFQVLQDNRVQHTVSAEYVHSVKVMEARPPSPGASVQLISPGSRTVLLLVDDLGLERENLIFVARAIRSFVKAKFQPGDSFAVMRTSGGVALLQPFTADQNALIESIRRLSHFANDGELDSARVRVNKQSPGIVGVFQVVHAILAPMPGRKSVVLFSTGLRIFDRVATENIEIHQGLALLNMKKAEAAREIVALANHCGAVLYTIDARGIQTFASGAGATQPGFAHQQTTVSDLEQSHLRYVAEGTGGVFSGDNDMGGALSHALSDQNGYYLVSYTPDDIHGEKLRDVEVRVMRKGLRARTRTRF